MKNSKALTQMLLMASLMSGDMEPTRGTKRASTPDRTPQEIKEEKEKNRKEALKKKGVNEYFFGGHSIMARTKDSAYKKAKKKGYIN